MRPEPTEPQQTRDADLTEPHLDPPTDLAARVPKLPLRRARPGTRWWRIHRLEYAPLYFGRSVRYRFDDPTGEYGVLYVGANPLCAFIETLGHNTGVNVIGQGDLRRRGLVEVEVAAPLRLVNLTGRGLQHLGIDARLTSGGHAAAQRWSRALWQHPSRPDGILYRSRHDQPRLCAAVFDRAADALRTHSLGSLTALEVQALYGRVFDVYRYVLVD